MVQLFAKEASEKAGASVSGDTLTDIVRCPDCNHMLGKVAPTPGVRVSFQCARCKRLVWYVIPPLKVLEDVIKRAKVA